MSDLISRQAAIKAVHEEFDECLVWDESGKCTADEVERILEDLPAEHPLDPCETCLHKGKGWDEDPCDGCTGAESRYEPDNWWIPVSERLPENRTRVLTTIKIPGREPKVRSCYYSGKYFNNDNGDAWKTTDPEVTEWMPLPDPYKEGEA